jgi:hypothetical protein
MGDWQDGGRARGTADGHGSGASAHQRQRGESVSEQTHRERSSIDHPGAGRVNQPGREEGIVRADAHPVQHERPEDWGWHGETGKWGRIASWVAILFVAAYLIGNHEGRVEDLWLIALVALMVLLKVYDWFRRRNAWRSQ